MGMLKTIRMCISTCPGTVSGPWTLEDSLEEHIIGQVGKKRKHVYTLRYLERKRCMNCGVTLDYRMVPGSKTEVNKKVYNKLVKRLMINIQKRKEEQGG